MHRFAAIALVSLFLCGCTRPSAAAITPPPPPPAGAAVRTPTAAPSPLPTPIPPTAGPATASLPPAAVAAAEAERAQHHAPGFDVAAQAGAMLPQFRGDLDQAGTWNRYTISATIDPQARTIAGRERLLYTNRDPAPLAELYFHLYPNLRDFAGQLTVNAVSVDGQAARQTYERSGYLLRVALPQPLAPGATADVRLDFAAQAPENASRRAYGAFNREQGVLALASSYPIVAIRRSGTWDTGLPDPQGDFVNSETALYDVTLVLPADWSLVTSGTAIDRQADGRQQTVRIVSGPQRDFAIAVTQFPHVSAEADGTRIHAYYRPGGEAGGHAALQAAANALRTFNRRYGPYPLAELDVIEIAATTFLGVEYPGLIMIERTLYGRAADLEITVAHEVAHQWWYSQVGNDVQAEAWIDEGLASFSQVVYQEEVYGPTAAGRELEAFRQRYRLARESGRDAPLDQPTAAFRNNYVPLVYGKSVLFFQKLREQIGEAAFDRFLHTFYAQSRYRFVGGNDLLAAAEGACSCELDRLYRDWVMTAAPVELP